MHEKGIIDLIRVIRVIHGYDKVDDVVIWGIVSKNLPELKKKVNHYLKE